LCSAATSLCTCGYLGPDETVAVAVHLEHWWPLPSRHLTSPHSHRLPTCNPPSPWHVPCSHWLTFWDDYITTLQQAAATKSAPTAPALVVRYEDLCLRLGQALPRLLQFIEGSVGNHTAWLQALEKPCYPPARSSAGSSS
jgi:hypothetical protein